MQNQKCLLGVLVLTIMVGGGCTKSQSDTPSAGIGTSTVEKIVDGIAVKGNSDIAKSTVLLINTFGGGHVGICTGSIISPSLIITAGHCVTATDDEKGIQQPEQLQIIFGKVRLRSAHNPNASAIKSDAIESDAELADQAPRNDIALVHFSGPLPEGYGPADILPGNVDLGPSDQIIVAGYGQSNVNADPNGELRATQMTFAGEDPKTNWVSLSGDSGGVACHGDSGGPGFVEKDGALLLWGIADTSDCKSGSDYLDLRAYGDWISAAARKMGEDFRLQ